MTWWSTRTECTLSEDIPAPPESVREFYANLENTIEVHPLVVSVVADDRVETAAGYTQRYRVRDRIPFGPLVLPIGYTAHVDVPRDGDIRTEARQFPRVRLDGIVSFEPLGGGDAQPAGTRLTEHLVIVAPRLLAGVTVREAKRAHQTMLAELAAHFAT